MVLPTNYLQDPDCADIDDWFRRAPQARQEQAWAEYDQRVAQRQRIPVETQEGHPNFDGVVTSHLPEITPPLPREPPAEDSSTRQPDQEDYP